MTDEETTISLDHEKDVSWTREELDEAAMKHSKQHNLDGEPLPAVHGDGVKSEIEIIE